jgi:hypothetical protein
MLIGNLKRSVLISANFSSVSDSADASAIPEIADAAISFLQTWKRSFELIVPVPLI